MIFLLTQSFAHMIPEVTDNSDAIHTGTIISNGADELNDALNVRRVVGIRVTDAVFITTNIHISSDAVSDRLFCASNFSIAEIPRGVAALDNPKRFAVMLIDIAPAISGFLYTFGKIIRIMG